MDLLFYVGVGVAELGYSLSDAPDTLLFHGGPGSYGVPGDMADAPDTLSFQGNAVSFIFTAGSMVDGGDTLFFAGVLGMVGAAGDMADAPDTLSFVGEGGAYIGSAFSLSDAPDTLLFSVANGLDAAVQEYTLYAMNMKNGAVTQLPYAVDSFCELNGIVYAAGPAGIMVFEGSDDNNGAAINARIAKSGINFSNNMRKTITDFFMRCRTQGSMKITSSSNRGVGSVTVGDGDDTLHAFKANLARGVCGSELGIAVENVDGCDFEIAEFEYLLDVSSHRRGK